MVEEEIYTVRQFVRTLVEDRLRPFAQEVDKREKIPDGHVQLLTQNKLFGTSIPSKYSGAGLSQVNQLVVIEEVARCCASTSTLLTNQLLTIYPILIGGTDNQKNKYISSLTTGDLIGAFGITEDGVSSDTDVIQTTATYDGEHYSLNGKKIFVLNAGEADIYLFAATVNPAINNAGLTYFIVEKDTPGLVFGKKANKMGIKGVPTREVILNDVKVPHTHLIGGEGKGFSILKESLNFTRLNVAAQALGIAQGAYDEALAYTQKWKKHKGNSSSFHGIKFLLADMATEIEAARRLLYYAGTLLDSNGREVIKTASMAKLFCSNIAMKITTDAVQILEGFGYTDDYPVERMMRDAKITQIYEGTNFTQRYVIGRQILL